MDVVAVADVDFYVVSVVFLFVVVYKWLMWLFNDCSSDVLQRSHSGSDRAHGKGVVHGA